MFKFQHNKNRCIQSESNIQLAKPIACCFVFREINTFKKHYWTRIILLDFLSLIQNNTEQKKIRLNEYLWINWKVKRLVLANFHFSLDTYFLKRRNCEISKTKAKTDVYYYFFVYETKSLYMLAPMPWFVLQYIVFLWSLAWNQTRQ